MTILASENTDSIPKLMSLAEGLDIEFLEILELKIDQDGSVDVVLRKAVDYSWV